MSHNKVNMVDRHTAHSVNQQGEIITIATSNVFSVNYYNEGKKCGGDEGTVHRLEQ